MQYLNQCNVHLILIRAYVIILSLHIIIIKQGPLPRLSVVYSRVARKCLNPLRYHKKMLGGIILTAHHIYPTVGLEPPPQWDGKLPTIPP